VSRPSTTGGVTARGSNGIQHDFMLQGVRYRPTLKQTPSEANLRRAREHLKCYQGAHPLRHIFLRGGISRFS
jgi:hypothetical protein